MGKPCVGAIGHPMHALSTTTPLAASGAQLYSLAADAILLVHLLFVAFMVLGLLLIYSGGFRHWNWVRNRLFRILHLAGIGIVVGQAWLGFICPLTTWEMGLRERSGEAVYSETFIQHWMGNALFFEAPLWVFTVCYTIFGAMVVASWFVVRPRRSRK